MAEIEIASFDDAQDPNNPQVSGLRLNSNSIWLKLPGSIGWVRSQHRSSIRTCVDIKDLLEGKFHEEIYNLQNKVRELEATLERIKTVGD